MQQITGYLSVGEHGAFHAYAAEFGLDASALANLVLVRELRLGRLLELAGKYQASSEKPAGVKVTAHLRDAALRSRFQAHAASVGLTVSRASALLFKAEIEERWLERAVNYN